LLKGISQSLPTQYNNNNNNNNNNDDDDDDDDNNNNKPRVSVTTAWRILGLREEETAYR